MMRIEGIQRGEKQREEKMETTFLLSLHVTQLLHVPEVWMLGKSRSLKACRLDGANGSKWIQAHLGGVGFCLGLLATSSECFQINEFL